MSDNSAHLIPQELERELRRKMSAIRLAKTGLFVNLEVPHEEIRQELLLFRKVLDKALIDMLSPHKEIKKDVEDWLDVKNEDFIICCENAFLEPKKVFNTFSIVKKLLRGKNARFKQFARREQQE